MSMAQKVARYLNHSDYSPLAKWRENTEDFRKARGFIFRDHYKEVLWGLDVLFTEPFFDGKEWQKSMAHALHQTMQLNCTFEQFHKWCLLATLGHDLGKCGGEFQQMLVSMELEYLDTYKFDKEGLAGRPDKIKDAKEKMDKVPRHRQVYRHEFLSALLMFHHPEIRQWFEKEAGSPEGFAYSIAGAFGHHLKGDRGFTKDASILTNRHESEKQLPVYLDKLSIEMNAVLEGTGLPAFPTLQRLGFGDRFVKKLEEKFIDMKEDPLFLDVYDSAISGAIKWLVIIADTYGSLSAEAGETVQQTRERILKSIQEVWSLGSKGTFDYADRYKAKIGGNPLRKWQAECGKTPGNLIVSVPTGGGKTVGALTWAAQRERTPLVYCGHTTDATTQFYYDYGDSTRDALRHSKAWLDIKFLPTLEENHKEKGGKSEQEEDSDEAEEMLDVLRGQDSEVTFATVDQVLGIMAFYRKSVMFLPYLLKSQVIFDEVASYDTTMLSMYFRFLKWMPGIPTAHLSATFPDALRTDIENQTGAVHRFEERIPESNQMAPRYRIHVLNSFMEAVALFEPGTLWFANTVERSQDLARMFPDTLLYHSRFKHEDRKGISQSVVEAFRDGNRPRVVATQAAEMALDISSLRLISEISPPASMIQRLGRSNRKLEYGVIDAYFYIPEAENGMPYVPSRDKKKWQEEYKKWADWLRQFKGQTISQDTLNTAYQEFHKKKWHQVPGVYQDMLTTYRTSVRDTIYTTPCLLKSDLDADPKMSPVNVQMKSVPIILKPSQKVQLNASKSLYRRVFVVDRSFGDYDPRLGFVPK